MTCQQSHLINRCLHTKCGSAAAGFGIFKRKGALHADLNVLADRVNEDGKDSKYLFGRQNCVHAHADHHYCSAGLIKPFRRHGVKDSKYKYQNDAG